MFKKPNSGKRSGNLSQFGLLDMDLGDNDDEPMDMSDDDIDLEAELAAISGEPKKPRPRKAPPVPAVNLDAMIADSLRDVPSDEEVSDEDDPDLLSELKELTVEDSDAPPPPPRASRPAPPPPGGSPSAQNSTVSMLQDRILNYTAAGKQAKSSGESSRARRFTRGLRTLTDLLKQAQAGKPISDADVPPPVVLKSSAPAPASPTEAPSAPEENTRAREEPAVPEEPTIAAEEPPIAPEPKEAPLPPPALEGEDVDPARQQGLQIILKRQQEFKAAALSSKHAGDKTMALEYLKVVKQFDVVADAYKTGQQMDLTELPTPQSIAADFRSQQKGEDETQKSAEPAPVPPPPSDQSSGLITASTVDEALRQRLAAFQSQESKAKEEGNTSKARRMGRIVKQYQDAIRLHAAGKPLPADELPTPAGYAPIPTDGAAAAPRPSPAPSRTPSAPSTPAAPRAPSSRYDKQLVFLLHRQKEFKDAALKAKKSGNIEQAKEYLRAAKGFDAVLEAARGGLTVDLKSLPLAPNAKTQIEHTFDVVSAEDCDPPVEVASPVLSDDDHDVLTKLSQQLTHQLKLCLTNRDHYREMGNIAEMNRFEHIAVRVQQDLDVVVVAKSLGNPPPKFHYEMRQFSVVQCNTDLNENDLELTIVRGIAFNVPNPKEVDTYVKFDFPYPQDAPLSDRTSLIKDTNSPVYDAVFTLPIHRGARACQRVFKRHAVKFEVYSRGGWFARDALLGTVAAKLAPLESAVTAHEAYPLMDGRRPAGGSLEVKLRLRTPLLQQQFENTNHRWLVVDN